MILIDRKEWDNKIRKNIKVLIIIIIMINKI
jgi:hypothetical protein